MAASTPLEIDKTTKPKILAVEDDTECHQVWQEILAEKVFYIKAQTIAEAEDLFARHPDVSAIIMDGCVPGNDLNTLPLVNFFRKTFKGPIVAASGCKKYREILMQNGCTHESEKWYVPLVLIEVLGCK